MEAYEEGKEDETAKRHEGKKRRGWDEGGREEVGREGRGRAMGLHGCLQHAHRETNKLLLDKPRGTERLQDVC